MEGERALRDIHSGIDIQKIHYAKELIYFF
jgi:hypothetical protein